MRRSALRFGAIFSIVLTLMLVFSSVGGAQEASSPSSDVVETHCGTEKFVPESGDADTFEIDGVTVNYICTTFDHVTKHVAVSAIYSLDPGTVLSYDPATPAVPLAGNQMITVHQGSIDLTLVAACGELNCVPTGPNQACYPSAGAADPPAPCAEIGTFDPNTLIVTWEPVGSTAETVNAGQFIRLRDVTVILKAGANGTVIGVSGEYRVRGGGCLRTCVQPSP